MCWESVLSCRVTRSKTGVLATPLRSINNVVHQEIHKLLQKRVFIEVKSSPSQIVSGIFLLPKKYGTNRFILNVKSFNAFATHHRFKMNSLHIIIKLVTPTCFMASIAMKDAYHV